MIEGVRAALVENPRASMADIARAAGIGMSAVYRRFPSREAWLRFFADEINRYYEVALSDAHDRLDGGADPRGVLQAFLEGVVDSGFHRLAVAVAGTFERTQEDLDYSVRLYHVGAALIERLHEAGVLRPGVHWLDVFVLLQALSTIDGATPDRETMLRRRMLDVVTAGLFDRSRPMSGEHPRSLDIRENRDRPTD